MFFFFNDTATTEIYTLSLHDALPISHSADAQRGRVGRSADPRAPHACRLAEACRRAGQVGDSCWRPRRSEEHTSELQSRQYLVCRLLLEKKKESNVTRIIDPTYTFFL